MAFGITDEIFGVTAAQKGKVSPWYSYGVMAVAIPGWTLGTALGAVSGNLLPGFITSALGIALYGMFVAVIVPPAKENRAVLQWYGGDGAEYVISGGAGIEAGVHRLYDYYRDCGNGRDRGGGMSCDRRKSRR